MSPTTNPFELYPELDTDWSRLDFNQVSTSHLTGFIQACLTDPEFRDILMTQYGTLILAASKSVLHRTMVELMQPLGDLEGYMDTDEGTGIDWAAYKKKQRLADHRAQVEALRLYWHRRQERRNRLRELRALIPRSKADQANTFTGDTTPLAHLIEPFSAKSDAIKDWHADLKEVIQAGPSRLLPWTQLISTDIRSGKRKLSDLTPVLANSRKDKAIKFAHLVAQAHEGKVKLRQHTPTDIEIIADHDLDSDIELRDADGRRYRLDYNDLTEAQRSKVLHDLKQHKVMLI